MPLTPFWHPLFVAWKSLPLPLGNPPFLTSKSLLCVVARIPIHSGPRLAVYRPPPTAPFPFPPPNSSPYLMHALSRRHCDISFTLSDTLGYIKILLHTILSCISSKYWKSYTPTTIRIKAITVYLILNMSPDKELRMGPSWNLRFSGILKLILADRISVTLLSWEKESIFSAKEFWLILEENAACHLHEILEGNAACHLHRMKLEDCVLGEAAIRWRDINKRTITVRHELIVVLIWWLYIRMTFPSKIS